MDNSIGYWIYYIKNTNTLKNINTISKKYKLLSKILQVTFNTIKKLVTI